MEGKHSERYLNEQRKFEELHLIAITLTARERAVILHTCGLDSSTSAYRNHYTASKDHSSIKELENLCKLQILEEKEGRQFSEVRSVYHLTEEGFQLARFIYRRGNEFKHWLGKLRVICRTNFEFNRKALTEFIDIYKEDVLWDCFLHKVDHKKVIQGYLTSVEIQENEIKK